MYVVIEGIDTAGKSTQLDILKKNYPDAIFTKEPGGTKIGLELREMVLNARAKSKIAEMFLFLADRAEHLEEVVKPNRGNMLISDRSMISGMAYAKDFPISMTMELNKIAMEGIKPDCVIMLELSQEELTRRLSGKSNDGIESRGIGYLLEIQSKMKMIIGELNINNLIVDASLPIETIAHKIDNFIKGK